MTSLEDPENEYPYPPDEWGYSNFPFNDPPKRQAAWDALTIPERGGQIRRLLREGYVLPHKLNTELAKKKAPQWMRWEKIVRGFANNEREVQLALASLARNWKQRQ